jgi:hypothetical protein
MQFGSTDFIKLFDDFNKTDNFNLIPAVRTVDSCVDEQGCDFEKYTSCAFSLTSSSGQVAFLACMDEKQHGTQAKADAEECAGKVSPPISFDDISSCFANGEGDKLLKRASRAFNDKLPGRTTIPHSTVAA